MVKHDLLNETSPYGLLICCSLLPINAIGLQSVGCGKGGRPAGPTRGLSLIPGCR